MVYLEVAEPQASAGGSGSSGGGRHAAATAKVPCFSKSRRLREAHAAAVEAASRNPQWAASVDEMSNERPRGAIAEALFELAEYARGAIAAHADTGYFSDIASTLRATSTYVLELYLEAVWLCLAKGFSSTCTAFLRLMPAELLAGVVTNTLCKCSAQSDGSLHRRISDLYALTTCDDILQVMGTEALIAAMRLLAEVNFDTHVEPEGAGIISASDAVSLHRSRVSALKAFNLLVFNRGRPDAAYAAGAVTTAEFRQTLRSVIRVLGNTASDRDVLCQCGVSLVGMLQLAHSASKPPRDLEGLLLRFLGSLDEFVTKFEGEDGCGAFISEERLGELDVETEGEDGMLALMLALPCLGCLSVVRGVLTHMYSVWSRGEGLGARHKGAEPEKNGDELQPTPMERDSFLVTALCRSHAIFKAATDTSLRVDINYATLQGMQLMMSFITRATFHCEPLYKCLLELPDLIFTYWTRKVRRISNLAICTWTKLMDIAFQMERADRDAVVTEYIRALVRAAADSFASIMKLKYISMQNLLRYVEPEEVLQRQPFLVSHLICALSEPATKGCATVFLTDLLTKIHERIKVICAHEGVASENVAHTALMTLHCVVYPTVIAVVHSRQLVLPGVPGDHLIPSQNASPDALEKRAAALAEAFKSLFGKIHRDYVFEMLRISTAFTTCEFYQYLPGAQQATLNGSGPYVVDSHHCFLEYVTKTIRYVVHAQQEPGSPAAEERIMYLDAPFNFAESMCLRNARERNSVEFVETEMNGRPLKGIVINDSPEPFKFDPAKLNNHPDVRLFHVPLYKLREGLAHIQGDLCLNVIKTVTCSPKTKQPVKRIEMELVLYALHHCMKTSIPSFRQHFVASIKPFIKRLHNIVMEYPDKLDAVIRADGYCARFELSGGVVLTRGANSPTIQLMDDAQYNCSIHAAYIRLMMKLMVATVNPYSSDFKNTTALELLNSIIHNFVEYNATCVQMGFFFTDGIIVQLYMALFYLSTRQQELLMKTLLLIPTPLLFQALKAHMGGGSLDYVVRKCAGSLWSVKTLPYISGAKGLALLLRGVPCNNGALKALSDGDLYSAVCHAEKGYAMHLHADAVVAVLDYLLQQLTLVCDGLDRHINVNDPCNASSPAGLLSLFSHYMDAVDVNVYSEMVNTPRFVRLLDMFYNKLKRLCDHILKYVGREHDNGGSGPRDYQIDCRGHLVAKTDAYNFTCVSDDEKYFMECRMCNDKFRCSHLKLMTTPKCSVPDDSNLRPFTVLCWKAVFEFCSAMRSMLQWILPQSISGTIALDTVRSEAHNDPGTNLPLFYDHIDDIGRYLISALMTSRHFGCTDAFAELLTWICKKLVILGIQRLLEKWVSFLLDMLKGYSVKDPRWSDLFVMLRDSHRRSEPIARAFTSILKAESDRHKPILLPLVVNTLMELSHLDHSVSERRHNGLPAVDVRIHSLNILCALFRCRELRWSNNIHASAALCTSLHNMSHVDWSVRNSAALLFSSVLHHLAGSDVNMASTEALLDQKLALCNNDELSEQLNSILEAVREMTVQSSETYETLNPVPKYAALYQSSAFVFNFLSRIPLYSFPAEISNRFTENITAILYSSNASIRVMAAKILAKNSLDSTQSSLGNLIVGKCRLIIEETGSSNRVNGMLLLIRECLTLMITSGRYDAIGTLGSDVGLLRTLPLVAQMVALGHVSDVVAVLLTKPTHTALIITMYVVMLTTNCFENLVEAVVILESMWRIYGRSATFEEVATNVAVPGYHATPQIAECAILLVIVASNVLGDEVYQKCLKMLTHPDKQDLTASNRSLRLLRETFDRVKDDDMTHVKAASTVVKSMFLLTKAAKNSSGTPYPHGLTQYEPVVRGGSGAYDDDDEAEEDVEVGPFVGLCTLMMETFSRRVSKQRSLESVMNQVSYLLHREQLMDCSPKALAALWTVGARIVKNEPQFFVHIAAFRMLNAVGERQLHRPRVDMVCTFNLEWATTVCGVVVERLLYNPEFFVEAWKNCHMYAMAHLDDYDVHPEILEMAAGLLLRAVDPGTDVGMRVAVVRFMERTGVSRPTERRYPQNGTGMYMLHVFAALMVLLQDESDGVRMLAASCAAGLVGDEGDCDVAALAPQLVMERLLVFVLRTVPTEWAVLLFGQLTMLDNDVLKIASHALEDDQQRIMRRQICLTTSAIDWSKVPPDAEGERASVLSTLAEMDTVFNVEPQNLYMETVLYTVRVDKLLCQVARSCLGGAGDAHMVPPGSEAVIRQFLADSAERALRTVQAHLRGHYQIADPEAADVPASAAQAVAVDPKVAKCSVVGFARSCLALVWEGDGGTDYEDNGDGTGADNEHNRRARTFHRLLTLGESVCAQEADEAYGAVLIAAEAAGGVDSIARSAKLAAIVGLERWLDLL